MRNKLYFAPLKDPKEILDIGTGTGIWAMEIGDHFPEATVSIRENGCGILGN